MVSVNGANSKNRYFALDILNCLATLIIMFHHYQQSTDAVFKYINFWNGRFYCGWIVELFFVISGFLTYTYISKIQGENVSFKSFYLKKFFRFMPMVCISCLFEEFITIMHRIFGSSWGTIDFFNTITSSLLIQTGWGINLSGVNNPTWYISVLMLCYALFYFCIWLSEKLEISPYYFFIGIILIGVGIYSFKIELPFFNSFSARGYYAFFTGIILHSLVQYKSKKSNIVCIFIFVICILFFIFKYEWIASNIQYTLSFIFYPILIYLICNLKMNKEKIIQLSSIFAEIAYISYLFHTALRSVMVFFIKAVQKLFDIYIDECCLSAMLLYTLFVIIFSTTVYFIVDKPITVYIQNKTTFLTNNKKES